MPLEKKLIVIIFGIWCVLAFKPVILQVQRLFSFLLPVQALSLEERHQLVDGSFYDFVKQCEARIGPRDIVMFKAVPRDPDFRQPDWFLKEYFVGRLSYFLYPRRILRGEEAAYKPEYIIIFDTHSKALRLTRT